VSDVICIRICLPMAQLHCAVYGAALCVLGFVLMFRMFACCIEGSMSMLVLLVLCIPANWQLGLHVQVAVNASIAVLAAAALRNSHVPD
jgi:hypothetical protein